MGEEGACQFSDGWLHRFKVCHGIRKLDISGESKSANLPSAEEFVDRFAKIVEEHNLTTEQIYNADETGLFYRCLPRTTLARESEGDVKGFKQSKDRLTVLCCANMAGTHKVKLCMVCKHKKPCCFKNVNYLPVDYRNQRSAWMTTEIFLDWFKHCFVPSVKENLKKNGLPEDSKCRSRQDTRLASNGTDNPAATKVTTSMREPSDSGEKRRLEGRSWGQGRLEGRACGEAKTHISDKRGSITDKIAAGSVTTNTPAAHQASATVRRFPGRTPSDARFRVTGQQSCVPTLYITTTIPAAALHHARGLSPHRSDFSSPPLPSPPPIPTYSPQLRAPLSLITRHHHDHLQRTQLLWGRNTLVIGGAINEGPRGSLLGLLDDVTQAASPSLLPSLLLITPPPIPLFLSCILRLSHVVQQAEQGTTWALIDRTSTWTAAGIQNI
ncbi:hypothetical protein O3P69_016979 [Scylla paramamosain]|uniref:HTH CENPB-type domain-containing protein n=1 Tax=Scylla paramamosain TaxID=85552 RepID=A0AAW0TTS4_SCYPA